MFDNFRRKKSASSLKDALFLKRIIEEEAEKSGIIIDFLRPTQEEKEFFQEATVTLKFNTLYQNLVDFIEALEAKDLEIEKLEMVSNASKRRRREDEPREGIEVTLIIKGIIIGEL